MIVKTERAQAFLDHLVRADDDVLVALAQQAHHVPRPPAFRGRCLEPAYLDAVAAGQWTTDDEGLLRSVLQQVEEAGLPRVRRRHRRRLRRALHAAALSLLTESLTSTDWQRRRAKLAHAWTNTIGPLPTASPGAKRIRITDRSR